MSLTGFLAAVIILLSRPVQTAIDRLEGHLKSIKALAADAKVFIVGTHLDVVQRQTRSRGDTARDPAVAFAEQVQARFQGKNASFLEGKDDDSFPTALRPATVLDLPIHTQKALFCHLAAGLSDSFSRSLLISSCGRSQLAAH